MWIVTALGFALAVGVLSGVIAYIGVLASERAERRRSAGRRQRKVHGL